MCEIHKTIWKRMLSMENKTNRNEGHLEISKMKICLALNKQSKDGSGITERHIFELNDSSEKVYEN